MLLREQCHRTLFTIQLFGVKSLWRNSLCFGRHRGATFVTLGNGRPHCPSTFCLHWIMRNVVLFTWFWSNVKHSQHSPGLGRTIRQIIRTESQTAGDTSSDSPWPLEDVVIHQEPQRISVGSCHHGWWVFFPFVTWNDPLLKCWVSAIRFFRHPCGICSVEFRLQACLYPMMLITHLLSPFHIEYIYFPSFLFDLSYSTITTTSHYYFHPSRFSYTFR
jgi:hypothetical protein